MKILSLAKALSLSLILATSTGASAATIFSQDFDPTLTSFQIGSDFGINFQSASSFSFTGGDQVLGSVSWLGAYTPIPSTDDFTIRIYADNGSGAPEITPSVLDFNVGNAVNRVDTGFDTGGPFFKDVQNYQADLTTAVNLTSGVTYWLSIVNDVATNGGDNWRWGASSLTSGTASNFRTSEISAWVSPDNYALQYELSTAPAAVPVPAALWLMLSGIAGLAAFKRKKQA